MFLIVHLHSKLYAKRWAFNYYLPEIDTVGHINKVKCPLFHDIYIYNTAVGNQG